MLPFESDPFLTSNYPCLLAFCCRVHWVFCCLSVTTGGAAKSCLMKPCSLLDLHFPLRGVSLTTADPRVLASRTQSTLPPHHPSQQPKCNPRPTPDWSGWRELGLALQGSRHNQESTWNHKVQLISGCHDGAPGLAPDFAPSWLPEVEATFSSPPEPPARVVRPFQDLDAGE